MATQKFSLVGSDYWNRSIFEKDGEYYVDVDGELYDMTDEGEPLTSIRVKTPQEA